MVPLPNYVVIDFLEWMREYHKDAQELVYQRDSWERHNEYIYKYINEYLEKDYRYFNKESYKYKLNINQNKGSNLWKIIKK